MATEDLTVNKEWLLTKNCRNLQKEKERERRRIRDRQRRQSMSLEEREKHLARRRRNYQLRRQKVFNSLSASPNESYEGNQALISVTGLVPKQLAAAFHLQSCKEPPLTSTTLQQGAERKPKAQRHRNIMPLYKIRHLARLLNSHSRGVTSDHQEPGTSLMSKDGETTESRLRGRIRLIDVKRLARALNSAAR